MTKQDIYSKVTDGIIAAMERGVKTGALAMVDKVRDKAVEIDGKAWFYSFGTCRIEGGDVVPVRAGSLNKYFGLPH